MPPRADQASQPASPMSGTNTHGPVRPLAPLVAVALDDEQLLLAARAHRDDHPPALAELLAERVGDRGGGGRDEDPVPRRAVRERPACRRRFGPRCGPA